MKDDFHSECSRLLLDLAGFLRVLNRDEKVCCGLTWPQAFAVEALAGGPLGMGALGDRLGVALSTATRILDLLVRDGLVKRLPGDKDRRRVRAGLTAKGREMARNLAACRVRVVRDMTAGLPATEKKHLVRAMKTVARAIAGGACCAGKGEKNGEK